MEKPLTLEQSLQIFETLKDDVGSPPAKQYRCYLPEPGSDEKALEYMLRSLQLAEKTGDT